MVQLKDDTKIVGSFYIMYVFYYEDFCNSLKILIDKVSFLLFLS